MDLGYHICSVNLPETWPLVKIGHKKHIDTTFVDTRFWYEVVDFCRENSNFVMDVDLDWIVRIDISGLSHPRKTMYHRFTKVCVLIP